MTRSRDAQLTTLCSEQSHVLESVEVLQKQLTEVEARFHGVDVPKPTNWGGYRIKPISIEFLMSCTYITARYSKSILIVIPELAIVSSPSNASRRSARIRCHLSTDRRARRFQRGNERCPDPLRWLSGSLRSDHPPGLKTPFHFFFFLSIHLKRFFSVGLGNPIIFFLRINSIVGRLAQTQNCLGSNIESIKPNK